MVCLCGASVMLSGAIALALWLPWLVLLLVVFVWVGWLWFFMAREWELLFEWLALLRAHKSCAG